MSFQQPQGSSASGQPLNFRATGPATSYFRYGTSKLLAYGVRSAHSSVRRALALDASPIHVEIDDRERASGVEEALRSLGVVVVARRLLLGDYLIDGALLVERKTLSDLVASVIDGRLFSQARRLMASRRRAVLVLEGTGADLARCGASWESLQGALITATWVFGLPILRTRSAFETARTIVFIARQHHAVVNGMLCRYGWRPKGKAALQGYVLQGLPGIGAERARRLLRRFGSVEAVVTASEKELCEVHGIGKSTAKRIRWAVEENPFNYPTSASPARSSRKSAEAERPDARQEASFGIAAPHTEPRRSSPTEFARRIPGR